MRMGHLPLDFQPWSMVSRWVLRLSQSGVLERLAHALTMFDRECAEREAIPPGCVVDAHAARSGGVRLAGERVVVAAIITVEIVETKESE